MSPSLLPGAEPFSATGGPDGALVLHGFTGNPSTMRGIAERLADAGLSVELPVLPGHGTSVEDMVETSWSDWSRAAEDAYQALAARCDRVAVVGLSMGGTLACWLAERHGDIAGLALVNPAVAPVDPSLRAAVEEMLAAGTEIMPGIGSDIADPEVVEVAYDQTPIRPLLSLFDAMAEVGGRLSEIRCPSLLFSSRQDHVVDPVAGDLFQSSVSGPCERIFLDRSYHVATLDYDREEIEERTVAFVGAVTAGVEQ